MKVGVVMGSTSDWNVMSGATAILDSFGIEYEKRVLSAHRTPAQLEEWASGARERGLCAIIAGAGGAAQSARLPIHDRTKRLALPARLSQYGMGLLSHC